MSAPPVTLVVIAALAVFSPAPATAGVSRIFTIAGTGWEGFSGDGGPATLARVDPVDLAALRDGSWLVAVDGRVRRVGRDGIIRTVAGTGRAGSTGDGGPATRARVDPLAIAALPAGGFLVADSTRVRRVGLDGRITTVAGSGTAGSTGDGGPAVAARTNPTDVAAMPGGGFLIAEPDRVRRVDASGVITTVAGTGGAGFSGDGGPATLAQIEPLGVSALPAGGFLIAEQTRIRRVDPDGIITTVAGTGGSGRRGDGGPATRAAIDADEVAALPAGGFLIHDSMNGTVRRVGTDGVISTVAGGGDDRVDETLEPWGFSSWAMGDIGAVGHPSSRADLYDSDKVAPLARGGFLIANVAKVQLVAGHSANVLGLAIGHPRGDHVTPSRYTTRVSVSRPARLRVDLLRGEHRVARRALNARSAGWHELSLRASLRPGVYTVRVTARAARVGRTLQTRKILAGDVLLDAWAVTLAGGRPGTPVLNASDTEPDETGYRTSRCRRFDAASVDCEVEATDDSGRGPYHCDQVARFRLRGGQVYRRSYECSASGGSPVFKARPKSWLEPPPAVPIDVDAVA